MKVQSLQLKHFKKFRDRLLDFTNQETGLAENLIVLVGMNGSGKTSVLQAIAATLGTATRRLKKISDLDWPGFNYELLGSNCQFNPEVTLQVEFSSDELKAVSEFQQKLNEMGYDYSVSPAQEHLVKLRWKNESVQAETPAEMFQFRGREYAKPLSRSEGFQIFERVGTIFWYPEQRTSTSLFSEDLEKKLEVTQDKLRDILAKWQIFHQSVESGKIKQLRPGQKDLYAVIENLYKKVFPERSFEGAVPQENIDDILSEPWFYLYDEDGKNLYEISEMSGGERAIFPVLMDFANWNIHNSVILIDEIELHLHPPLQQKLLRVLPDLGNNNQFIITTHSDYVVSLVPETNIIRL